jgi:cytochrome c-type biogenesis protein CcmH
MLDEELRMLIYLHTASEPVDRMAEIQNSTPEGEASFLALWLSVSSNQASDGTPVADDPKYVLEVPGVVEGSRRNIPKAVLDVSMTMGRSRRAWPVYLLLLPIVLLLVGGCTSSTSSWPLSPEELELKAQGIDKALMCPICPAETIDQSQVALANQMQAIVREKLAQGESREEILQYFVDAYGPAVLAEPPKRGFSLLVWVIPVVGLIVGGGILVAVVRGMRRTRDESPAEEEPLNESELKPYLSQIDHDIQRLTTGGLPLASKEGSDEGTSERRIE